jgi:hypothetical protein
LPMGIGLLVILHFSFAFWYELCPRDGFRVQLIDFIFWGLICAGHA